MRTYYPYNTAFGKVTIGAEDGAVVALAFGDRDLGGARQATPLTNAAATQIQEYLAGKRRLFDIPLRPGGTPFQKQVWHALEAIPYGETRTYTQVARAIGRPGAARAVGGANHANPIPLLIPCHRVVPANGGVGGYAAGPKAKAFLLDLEERHR